MKNSKLIIDKYGIAKFSCNIINFFQKLFGNNKICACGAAH